MEPESIPQNDDAEVLVRFETTRIALRQKFERRDDPFDQADVPDQVRTWSPDGVTVAPAYPDGPSTFDPVSSAGAPVLHELGDAWVIVELAPDAVLVVAEHRASEQATRERLVLADQERIGAGLRHGVINHLFAVGLKIQSVANQMEPDVAQRLLDLADELDLVIREIRDTVLHKPIEPDRRSNTNEKGFR